MYRFPLESVLIHREFIVENLQKDLAESEIKLIGEKRKIDELKKKKEDCARELSEKRETIAASECQLYIYYIHRLEEEMKAIAKQVAEAEKERDGIRMELVEATRKQKTMEKLKEKGLAQYESEMAGKERAFLGEIAVNRYNLGMRETE